MKNIIFLTTLLFITFCYGQEQQSYETLKKLAEQGDANAQYKLGDAYDLGKLGLKKSEYQAIYWYEKAAEQGNGWAQISLASLYEFSETEKNNMKALYWYDKATEYEDPIVSVQAMWQLTGIYEKKGEYQKAFNYYRKFAEIGDTDIEAKIGYYYSSGIGGVEQSYEKAVYWLTKAAEKGHVSSQFNLALCYEEGNGVEQSYSRAAYWYKNAAEQNFAEAQHNLASLYYSGKGIEQSKEKAIYWYRRACNNFSDSSCKMLNEIKEQINNR